MLLKANHHYEHIVCERERERERYGEKLAILGWACLCVIRWWCVCHQNSLSPVMISSSKPNSEWHRDNQWWSVCMCYRHHTFGGEQVPQCRSRHHRHNRQLVHLAPKYQQCNTVLGKWLTENLDSGTHSKTKLSNSKASFNTPPTSYKRTNILNWLNHYIYLILNFW